ncbi:hypothetical protein F5879DRAFT_996295 [Lentinula edodes]|nr:hypothetical protein F5879DRAFT_996295 [Lentinula edodes]
MSVYPTPPSPFLSPPGPSSVPVPSLPPPLLPPLLLHLLLLLSYPLPPPRYPLPFSSSSAVTTVLVPASPVANPSSLRRPSSTTLLRSCTLRNRAKATGCLSAEDEWDSSEVINNTAVTPLVPGERE